jgi:hypothetical protein
VKKPEPETKSTKAEIAWRGTIEEFRDAGGWTEPKFDGQLVVIYGRAKSEVKVVRQDTPILDLGRPRIVEKSEMKVVRLDMAYFDLGGGGDRITCYFGDQMEGSLPALTLNQEVTVVGRWHRYRNKNGELGFYLSDCWLVD